MALPDTIQITSDELVKFRTLSTVWKRTFHDVTSQCKDEEEETGRGGQLTYGDVSRQGEDEEEEAVGGVYNEIWTICY